MISTNKQKYFNDNKKQTLTRYKKKKKWRKNNRDVKNEGKFPHSSCQYFNLIDD